MLFFLLAIIVCTLGATAGELPAATRVEGWKLLGLLVLPIPWIVEIVLGQTHQFNRIHHGPKWVAIVSEAAFWANPALWLVAFLWLKRARPCVTPFIAFNAVATVASTIVAGCDLAGACF